MKLSSRKKLLDDASKTLSEIRKDKRFNPVNEIDWEEHEKWASSDDMFRKPKGKWFKKVPAPWGTSQGYANLADLVKDYKLHQIEQKYKNSPPDLTSSSQKRAEIYQMLRDIVKIRQHLTQPRQRIPKDPSKQTELQKILVNWKETISDNWYEIAKENAEEAAEQIRKTRYTDPETGLSWSGHYGGPQTPEEWRRILKDPEWGYEKFFKKDYERIRKESDERVAKEKEWEESRGVIWKLMDIIFKGYDLT